MFLALLACGIAVLTTLLGIHKDIKHIRVYICVITIFCIVVLVLALVTENPFTGKKNAPLLVIYVVPISPIIISPDEIIRFGDEIKKLQELTGSETMEEIQTTIPSLKENLSAEK